MNFIVTLLAAIFKILLDEFSGPKFKDVKHVEGTIDANVVASSGKSDLYKRLHKVHPSPAKSE